MFHCPHLTLASSSPRRRAILNQLKIPYSVLEPNIDEKSDIPNPSVRVKTIAEKKVRAIQDSAGTDLIIAADTIVALPKEVSPTAHHDNAHTHVIFEKPRTEDEARTMLTSLSGKSHTVYSGICVKYKDTFLVKHDATTVEFIDVNTAMREAYLASKEWQGVAGGYRIQGLGAYFIKSIHGSYSNVMGLPIVLLFDMIKPYITF